MWGCMWAGTTAALSGGIWAVVKVEMRAVEMAASLGARWVAVWVRRLGGWMVVARAVVMAVVWAIPRAVTMAAVRVWTKAALSVMSWAGWLAAVWGCMWAGMMAASSGGIWAVAKVAW